MEDSTNAAAEEKQGCVAAFFDIDGTLLPLPSLERRLLASLLRTGQLRLTSLMRWLLEAARMAPRGIETIRFANKAHVRGVSCSAGRSPAVFPAMFPGALDRLAWHAARGHRLVLVSGTPEFLAQQVASTLEERLRARGHLVSIRVFATRLDELDARWTGRVLGEPIVGKAKARAAKRIGQDEELDLSRSFAYGDCAGDRWLLAAVGFPAAVNPSPALVRIAALHNWPVLCWKCGEKTERGGETPTATETTAAAIARRELNQ